MVNQRLKLRLLCRVLATTIQDERKESITVCRIPILHMPTGNMTRFGRYGGVSWCHDMAGNSVNDNLGSDAETLRRPQLLQSLFTTFRILTTR